MFTCIVPSPVYLPVGTVVHGTSDLSDVPDFMLGMAYVPLKNQLEEHLGDDIQVPACDFYKAYAIWNNVIYEYSLMGSVIPTLDTQDRFLFPISVKRYYSSNKTYMYIKSLETITSLIKPSIDISKRSTYVSITTFFDQLIRSCKPDECYYLDVTKSFRPAYYDAFLSMESPYEIGNMLHELGHDCLSYGSSAVNFLYFNYGQDVNVLGEVFSYGKTDDLISAYGCSDSQAFPMKRLLSQIDSSSNYFYNNLAEEQIMRNKGMFNLQYLDTMNPWWNLLRIEELLDEIYGLSCTDAVADITVNKCIVDTVFLFNKHEDPCVQSIFDRFRVNINDANRGLRNRQIVRCTVDKTWLDELFISLAFDNGEILNLYMNLTLFHLYSPSIIRKPLLASLNSSNF